LHAGQRREEPDSTTQGHADTSLIAVIIFFFLMHQHIAVFKNSPACKNLSRLVYHCCWLVFPE